MATHASSKVPDIASSADMGETPAKKNKFDNVSNVNAKIYHDGKSMAKSDENLHFNKYGQWSLEKSNYGPKKIGKEKVSLYNPEDNANRKEANTGESLKDIGKNVNVKKITTTGTSMQAAHEKTVAKEQAKKTKASTKIFTPEQIAEMNAKRNAEKT